MQMGGASRPYYIGTRQTAIFCELQGPEYDLQDYNTLLAQIFGNTFARQQATARGEAFVPTGRKELTPSEARDFCYSALAAGARKSGMEVDFDPDDVADWIDEAPAGEVLKPVLTHLALMGQRLERQKARPATVGNGPAPTLKKSRGGRKAQP